METVDQILARLRRHVEAPQEILTFIDELRGLADHEAGNAARAMTAAAGAADAPPELRAVARRVQRGELTWATALRGDSTLPDVQRLAAVVDERLAAVRRVADIKEWR